jgi:hypothetical protein
MYQPDKCKSETIMMEKKMRKEYLGQRFGSKKCVNTSIEMKNILVI